VAEVEGGGRPRWVVDLDSGPLEGRAEGEACRAPRNHGRETPPVQTWTPRSPI
jgi:hypothetical protein